MAVDKLRVFLSWSGDRSRVVAEALREWLPCVLQAVDPWMSAADIEAGARWQSVVSGELQASSFSIICLTPENLNATWLHFEAGAVSKHGEARVCTYLYDLAYEDVKPPLSQFQHTPATQEGTRKLVADINKHLGNAAVGIDLLPVIFDKWWGDLETRLAGVAPAGVKPQPPDDLVKLTGMVAEMLNTMREQSPMLQQMVGLVEATARPDRLVDSQRQKAPLSGKSIVLAPAWFRKFRQLLADRGHTVGFSGGHPAGGGA